MTEVDLGARLRAALAHPGAGSSDFDLNPGFLQPEGRRLRPAAVLVAIKDGANGPRLILTKRASGLQHHPGQIAFPGGKVDMGDAGPQDAALREAEEEIALPRHAVEIIGSLSPHETVTGFTVTPFLGIVRDEFKARPAPGEVAEVFSVPLNHVTCVDNYFVQSRHWRRQRRYYYTVPYGPYYIWGATARILRGLAERLGS
ncbi:MAG: CoA pyrophosphatase [Halocynthiibacter sp.]